MRNRLLLFSIFSFFLTTLLISCSGLEREKDTLELDKSSILINQEGGSDCVSLIVNGPWEIQDIPEWISLSNTSGDYSDLVTLEVKENKEPANRKVTLLIVRGKANETLEVEQLGLDEVAPFIKLDTDGLDVGCFTGLQTVKLTTNKPWKLFFAPDWITVTPSSGDKSAEITIRIAENRDPERRESMIIFRGEIEDRKLDVRQSGLRDIAIMPGLPIFHFKQMEYSSGLSRCRAWTNSLFINPSIRNEIYLGNLICPTTQSNTNIPGFTGYTFNPITISTSAAASEVVKTYLPSRSDQDAFARQIAEAMSDEGKPLIEGAFEFYTHKQLQTIGMINLGVKLDELVSGFAFTEKEMTRKYGLIYSFKRTFFSLDMDIPEKLIQEELKDADKEKGVSYVSSVTYGRVGLLIVESDKDSREVKVAVDRLIAGKPLSQVEADLLSGVDVYYVYFDKDQNVQVQKGNQEVVDVYKEARLMGSDGIYPVEFGFANYMDNSPGTISFSYRAGE